jgi:hypothetical protein
MMNNFNPVVGHHYFSRGYYSTFCVVEDVLPVKIGERWISHGIVICKNTIGENRFARLTSDFVEEFEPE